MSLRVPTKLIASREEYSANVIAAIRRLRDFEATMQASVRAVEEMLEGNTDRGTLSHSV